MASLTQVDRSSTSTAAERSTTVRFCTRCGQQAEGAREEHALARRRVCEGCGMGVLLTCLQSALPGAQASFFIVTASLRISAVSEAAERLLGPEDRLLGSYLPELLTSPTGDDKLSHAVARAALRNREPVVLPVRGVGTTSLVEGVLAARVSTCGPPRGALITVVPSAFGTR
jgi:hypothetical protein